MSSYNKYWDIDDILMSNEQMTCMADKDLRGVNFNDKTAHLDLDAVTKEGQKLELPLWLAKLLRKKGYITIRNPKFMAEKFYNQIVADPTIINFKNKNNYIYDLYIQLIPMLDENHKWSKNTAFAFFKRLFYLFMNSTDIHFENHSLIKTLSFKEKRFYDESLKINRSFKYYLEFYCFNNKSLEEIVEAKKLTHLKKKTKK